MEKAESTRLDKAKEKLEKYKEDRQKWDNKVKEQEVVVKKLEEESKIKKFSEAEDVINAAGISLIEITEAIKSGDLTSLQKKIKEGI